MNFSLLENAQAFQSLVQRLLDEESSVAGSDLAGFTPVSAERRGDLGIDGFLPNGTIFQIYYALRPANTPMATRERRKISETCRKLAKQRGRAESTIGARLTKVVFILGCDPDVAVTEHCSETVSRLLPGATGGVWGETRLSNLVSKHRRAVADLLPPQMRMELPRMQLLVNSGDPRGTSIVVAVGLEIAGPNFDADVFGRFLDEKDSRFKVATCSRRDLGSRLRKSQYHNWANYRFNCFVHYVRMTLCPRIAFEVSNVGEAYAHGLKVELRIPKELNLILASDLPCPPGPVPHPNQIPDTESVATRAPWQHADGVEEMPEDDDILEDWRYPRVVPLAYARRSLSIPRVSLTSDGSRLVWDIGTLEHQGQPARLDCAGKPPCQGAAYDIEYVIHCEEHTQPVQEKAVLKVNPLDDVQTMDLAWRQMDGEGCSSADRV